MDRCLKFWTWTYLNLALSLPPTILYVASGEIQGLVWGQGPVIYQGHLNSPPVSKLIQTFPLNSPALSRLPPSDLYFLSPELYFGTFQGSKEKSFLLENWLKIPESHSQNTALPSAPATQGIYARSLFFCCVVRVFRIIIQLQTFVYKKRQCDVET